MSDEGFDWVTVVDNGEGTFYATLGGKYVDLRNVSGSGPSREDAIVALCAVIADCLIGCDARIVELIHDMAVL